MDQTIRIFISSTFRDMEAERDHLARIVFPELREKCRSRHVQLIDVDLRWGVTEAEVHDGKALDTCLQTIDACRPFFLSLLGHRYGWVPPDRERSITEEEIRHAVLHQDLPLQLPDLAAVSDVDTPAELLGRTYRWSEGRRAYLLREDVSAADLAALRATFAKHPKYRRNRCLFCFRSASLSSALAGREAFEEAAERQARLEDLKARIGAAGLPRLDYETLESFGRHVTDGLWRLLEEEIGSEGPPKPERAQEDEDHEIFLAQATRLFVGRREVLARLHDFAVRENGPGVFMLQGEPGSGKSAVLARFVEEARRAHPDWLVLPHFVAANPASSDLGQLLYRVCDRIGRVVDEYPPGDLDRLIEHFPGVLARAARRRRIVLVIDALDQIARWSASPLRWLPQEVPHNVRIVVSIQPQNAQDSLPDRGRMQEEILQGLTESETAELTRLFLAQNHRELPNPQVRTLFFARVKAGNPLYLVVALEEMRVVTRFEDLPALVERLPGDLPLLFARVLERIESDLGAPLVRDALSCLACSRHGLTAGELQPLLRSHGPGGAAQARADRLPDLIWSRLFRSLSAYLFLRGEVIDFFHDQLKDAALRRYLADREVRLKAHQRLVQYFHARRKEPDSRALAELPYQLLQAEDWDGAEELLCDLDLIAARCAAGGAYALVADYSAVLAASAQVPWPGRERVREFARFVRSQAHVLSATPNVTVQQAANEPAGSAVAEAARRKSSQDAERSTWLRWVNKPRDESQIMTLICESEIVACAYSPNGRQLAAAVEDNVRIWDAETGAAVATLWQGQHGPTAGTFAYSSDGRRLVSVARQGGDMILWDPRSGSRLAAIETPAAYELSGVALSPDSRWIVAQMRKGWHPGFTAREGAAGLYVWDLDSGAERHRFDVDGLIAPEGFSADGRRALSASRSGELTVWDLGTGEPLARLSVGEGLSGMSQGEPSFASAAWLADGRTALAVGTSGLLTFWEPESNEVRCLVLSSSRAHSSRGGFSVDFGVFSPDRRLLAAAVDRDSLRLFAIDTGDELAVLGKGTASLPACGFSRDGRRVWAALEKRVVKIWDVQTLVEIASFSASLPCALSPDNRRFAAIWAPEALRVWELGATAASAAAPAGHDEPVTSCSYAPGGRRFLACSRDGVIKVWDHSDAATALVLRGSYAWDSPAAGFSADGGSIVSVAGQGLKVWNAATGAERWRIWLQAPCNDVACSPDGRSFALASGAPSERGAVEVRSLETGAEIFRLPHDQGVLTCSYTPDGRYLVAAEMNRVRVWRTDTGQSVWTRAIAASSYRRKIACSPDGALIASGSDDNVLRIWNRLTGAEVTSLRGRYHDARCAFSPDGRRIAWTSDENQVRISSCDGTGPALILQHEGLVTACAYVASGRLLVTTSRDASLRVWDAATGEERTRFTAEAPIEAFALGGGGACLAAGDSLGKVYVLDLFSPDLEETRRR